MTFRNRSIRLHTTEDVSDSFSTDTTFLFFFFFLALIFARLYRVKEGVDVLLEYLIQNIPFRSCVSFFTSANSLDREEAGSQITLADSIMDWIM